MNNYQTRGSIICNKNLPAKSGIYFWYMKYNAFINNFPIELQKVNFHEEQKIIYNGCPYLLVYVGIANKMSLQKRILWHIDDSHSLSKIKSKTLSTLRQSLSSILYKTWNCKTILDDFIEENMIVCCEAIENFETREKQLIQKYILPLNIQHNHSEELKNFIKTLKYLRKKSRENAIEEINKKA